MTKLSVICLGFAAAILAASASASGQQPPSAPSRSPPEIELTPDQRAQMARREEAESRVRAAEPNQQATARELPELNNEQMRAIVVELDRSAIEAARSGGAILPVGPRRDRMELAWYSGRLTRDGAYAKESSVPEGKAVESYLVYDPATGPTESWPPVFLPGFSPAIESGSVRNPLPMFYEMRVNAKADGDMVFALLVSMGGKKVLVSGIAVKPGGFAKLAVPGGHTIAVHATLRDQTAMEKEQLKRMTAARAQGQQALDEERITLSTTLPLGTDPSRAIPSDIIERMRATTRRESAIRELGAKP